MIDCGACGGKRSARKLNLPIVKGLVVEKTVDLLRDTGCEGVVVRGGLVDDDQLKVRFDCQDHYSTVGRKGQDSNKVTLSVRRSGGLCISEAICNLVVGNAPSARNPDVPDMTAMVGAVTKRAQARQVVRHKPLTVPHTLST